MEQDRANKGNGRKNEMLAGAKPQPSRIKLERIVVYVIGSLILICCAIGSVVESATAERLLIIMTPLFCFCAYRVGITAGKQDMIKLMKQHLLCGESAEDALSYEMNKILKSPWR